MKKIPPKASDLYAKKRNGQQSKKDMRATLQEFKRRQDNKNKPRGSS